MIKSKSTYLQRYNNNNNNNNNNNVLFIQNRKLKVFIMIMRLHNLWDIAEYAWRQDVMHDPNADV